MEKLSQLKLHTSPTDRWSENKLSDRYQRWKYASSILTHLRDAFESNTLRSSFDAFVVAVFQLHDADNFNPFDDDQETWPFKPRELNTLLGEIIALHEHEEDVRTIMEYAHDQLEKLLLPVISKDDE